jgi:hypothetical protein
VRLLPCLRHHHVLALLCRQRWRLLLLVWPLLLHLVLLPLLLHALPLYQPVN